MNRKVRNRSPTNLPSGSMEKQKEKKTIKTKNMRTKEFEVPSDFITEFAEALAEHELTNEINGVNEEGDILIEVSYEKQERANVFTLSELLDDYYESEEESEE
jgi:hypothetical protein